MYLLEPNNKNMSSLRMSAFHWPLILDQCGTYFIAISRNERWFYVQDVDERMGESPDGPAIIMNSGFPVTEEESKALARIARNYVAIQRALEVPDPIMPAIKPILIDAIEEFAEWSEKSGGFQIR